MPIDSPMPSLLESHCRPHSRMSSEPPVGGGAGGGAAEASSGKSAAINRRGFLIDAHRRASRATRQPPALTKIGRDVRFDDVELGGAERQLAEGVEHRLR